MKPYFTNGRQTIYHGRAEDVLPILEASSTDLLLTDPPYGVQWQSGHRNTSFLPIEGDDSLDAARIGVGLALVALRSYRHLYVFGRMPWDGLPITSPVELIWDKGQPSGGDVSQPWGPGHEYIQFGVYVPSTQNRNDGYGRLAARLRRGSVIQCQRVNGVAVQRHPTEKPVSLLRQLIESSSCIGETVLDPFMGVGSTLVAALLEGRRAIGIEVEERYCEEAAARLRALDLPLFADLEPAS